MSTTVSTGRTAKTICSTPVTYMQAPARVFTAKLMMTKQH